MNDSKYNELFTLRAVFQHKLCERLNVYSAFRVDDGNVDRRSLKLEQKTTRGERRNDQIRRAACCRAGLFSRTQRGLRRFPKLPRRSELNTPMWRGGYKVAAQLSAASRSLRRCND